MKANLGFVVPKRITEVKRVEEGKMIARNWEWDSFNYSPRIQQFSVLSLSFNTVTRGFFLRV